MAVIGIVAVDRRGAIGRRGAVPWRYPADLKFFREQTTGHACVMGRRTWESLGRPLKNRLNIILSRTADIPAQAGVMCLRDRIEALSLKEYLAGDLYVIGGEQIYRAFAGEIDRWLVTRVPLAVEDADTFLSVDFVKDFSAADVISLGEGVEVTRYERVRH